MSNCLMSNYITFMSGKFNVFFSDKKKQQPFFCIFPIWNNELLLEKQNLFAELVRIENGTGCCYNKNDRPQTRTAVSKQANLTNQNGLSFNPVARLFVQLTPWEFYH